MYDARNCVIYLIDNVFIVVSLYSYIPIYLPLPFSILLMSGLAWIYFLLTAVQQILRRRKRLQSRELGMHLTTGLMLKGPYVKSNFFAIWIMRM